MRLFSYVLDHDFGFAPNPFHGVCTLATCKPIIRRVAAVGDLILGTASSRRRPRGHLVYFMLVEEKLTFDQYWSDERFFLKRPNVRGSKMQAFGDNVYHKNKAGKWLQENCFHSLRDGKPNPINRDHDTQTNQVLVSRDFAYWGGTGPKLPARFSDPDRVDIVAARGHKSNFEERTVTSVLAWLRGLNVTGLAGTPFDWPRSG